MCPPLDQGQCTSIGVFGQSEYNGRLEGERSGNLANTAGSLTLNGLTIRYTITGQGAPMLLVHGHASSQDLWAKKNLSALEGYCRYTLDLPGHGASDKPRLTWFSLENYTELLAQFCRQFDLKDILLVGDFDRPGG
jgi:hypothetical protein